MRRLCSALLSIGIFCDDRKVVDEVCHHYRVGPVNSGITRYVYPSSQCEETTRDQRHARKLGIRVSGAHFRLRDVEPGGGPVCRPDNRLALGYEYTASLLLGEKVHVYGKIQDTQRRLQRYLRGRAAALSLYQAHRSAELQKKRPWRLAIIRAECLLSSAEEMLVANSLACPFAV